jgi:uncharacterized membrane protein
MELHLVLQNVGVVVFLIGIFHVILVSVSIFRKSGGFDNYQISRIKASIVGFLIFIPYIVIVMILFAPGDYLRLQK